MTLRWKHKSALLFRPRFFGQVYVVSLCVSLPVVLAAGGCTVAFDAGRNENQNVSDGGGHPVCGNGVLESGEVCDATDFGGQTCLSAVGKPQGELACNSECQLDLSDCSLCGDGRIEGSETCDDENTIVDDGCSPLCRMEPGWVCTDEPSTCEYTCGNSVQDSGEACDDGNIESGDGCDPSCQPEAGWTCHGFPSQCVTTCGDAIIAGAEQCDDGNIESNDGCDMACTIEHGWDCTGQPSVCVTTCGDGQLAPDEACDDGNTQSDDGCNGECLVEEGWSCENEPSQCTPICGDGKITGPETCDDGNAVDGDGCNADCQIEAYYRCSGQPSICTCVVFVNRASVAGPRTGESWSQAYETVQQGVEQAAFVAATGGRCEVWVAAETYPIFESSNDDTLTMDDDVALYGGFAGTETTRSARDWELNPTVIDGGDPNNSQNGVHTVITALGVDNAILDGFVITGSNGYAYGGGLRVENSTNFAVQNCTLTGNRAYTGGGAGFSYSEATISDCVFDDNETVQDNNDDTDGGGLAVEQGTVAVTGCLFFANAADDDGGGLYVNGGTHTVHKCVFDQNVGGDAGGGMNCSSGHVQLSNTIFTLNQGHFGGGIGVNCTLDATNTLLASNIGEVVGGADHGNDAFATYINCVFYANTSSSGLMPGGGIRLTLGADVEVHNSILASNDPNQIQDSINPATVRYSCIEGGHSGSGNINASPEFVDASGGDFHLQAGSPCIDSAYGDLAPLTDLHGNLRVDDPDTPNDGDGSPDYADMGVLEYQP